MEDYDETPPSLPANYITIVDLQKRWMEQQQKKHLHLKQETDTDTDTPTDITSRTHRNSHFQNPNFRNRNRNRKPPESNVVQTRGLTTVQVQQLKQQDSSNHNRIITHTHHTYPDSQFHQSDSYGNPNFRKPQYKNNKRNNNKKTADVQEDEIMPEVAVSRPKTLYLGNRRVDHTRVSDEEKKVIEDDQTAEIESQLKELSVSENESMNPKWAKRNWGERGRGYGRNMAAVRNWGVRGRGYGRNMSREMVWVKRSQSNVQSSHD